MNRKRYSGASSEEMASALGTYFPRDSGEYKAVMSDWSSWVHWDPGKRRPKKAKDGSRIPQEQPEYRQCFTIRMDSDTGEIRFKKTIIFRGETKRGWNQRRHGILKNMSGYQLTV